MDQLLEWIRISAPSRIAILTGAGISAESGIPTFRGTGGLWENWRPEELATPEAFGRDPELVWRWYEWRRNLIAGTRPNAAHAALAELEQELGSERVTLITQNVDGLHRRAGSQNVIELHGNITRARCTSEATTIDHPKLFGEALPRCRCGAPLRPDVVWFGEALPEGAIERASAAVIAAHLLLVIGTSGVVYPAAGLVQLMAAGEAAEINPDPTPLTRVCRFAVRATASEATPRVVRAILKARS